eukprot:gene20451-biopygen10111
MDGGVLGKSRNDRETWSGKVEMGGKSDPEKGKRLKVDLRVVDEGGPSGRSAVVHARGRVSRGAQRPHFFRDT